MAFEKIDADQKSNSVNIFEGGDSILGVAYLADIFEHLKEKN